jgi:phosphoserine phosphatase
MKLALFDLDHTLLPIDSADSWSHYLVRRAGLDADEYGARIRHFAATYKAGRLCANTWPRTCAGKRST